MRSLVPLALLIVVTVNAKQHQLPFINPDSQQNAVENGRLNNVTPLRFDGDQLLRIQSSSRFGNNRDWLMQFIDDQSMGLDTWAVGEGWVDVRVPAAPVIAVRQTLDDRGCDYSTRIDDIQATIDSDTSINSFSDQRNSQNNRYDPIWLDRSADQDPFFQQYQSQEAIKTFLDAVVDRFPNLASHVSIGTTYEGRSIIGVRIGSQVARMSGKRNHIVFHGGQHSREWISVAVNCYLIRQLLTGSQNDSAIASLLNTFEFTIIPVMNPDGYAYTQKNRLWRKNREPTSIPFCLGVDSNRNWNFSWATGGSSSNPCSDAYHGPHPFSTREASSVANYINALEGRVISYIDWHAYSQLWMYPFSYTCNEQPKEAEQLRQASLKATQALKALYGKQFKEGAVCRIIYKASGSSIDWTFANGVKYSFAVELRDTGTYGFLLPADQILPSGAEVLAAVKALYSHVKQQENL
jgi:murein tripeptide amidase MpaA